MTGPIYGHAVAAPLSIPSIKEVKAASFKDAYKAYAKDALTQAPNGDNSSSPAELPIAIAKGTTSYLATLTDAYSAIYKVMSTTVMTQITEETKLQNLDQTMSQIVLSSTNTAIQQQKTVLEQSLQMQQEYNEKMQTAQTWQFWSEVVGAVMFVGMLGLAVATGGAGAAADAAVLPEVAELTDMSSEAIAPSVMEDSMDEMGTELSDISDSSANSQSFSSLNSTDEEADDTLNTIKQTRDYMDSSDRLSSEDEYAAQKEGSDSEVEPRARSDEDAPEWMSETTEMLNSGRTQSTEYASIDEQTETDLESSDKTLNESSQKWKRALNRLTRMMIGGATGTFFAMPYFYQARASFFQSECKNKIADLTKTMGPYMGIMQENNMFFQYYQQLVQRGSQFVQQLAQQAGDVVETDATVMNSYSQMAVSLAQSA